MRQFAALFTAVALVTIAAGTIAAVPSSPTGLAAVVNGNTVSLTWNGPGGVVAAYRLEAGTAPGLTDAANTIVGVSPSFAAPGVPAGTYFVRVRAIGFDGEGPPSNEVVVVVGGGGCATPPNAPQLSPANVTGNVVTFNWTAAGGCAATNYTLLAGSAPGLSNVAVAHVGLVTNFTASAPAGTYYVRVAAQNVFGFGPPSNEVAVVIAGPLGFSRTGTANTFFDLPASVSRVRVIASYQGPSRQFSVWINQRLVVNQRMGTAFGVTGYDAVHETGGGGRVEIVTSVFGGPTDMAWSVTQVP